MNARSQQTGERMDLRDATRTAFILAGLFWLILLYPTNFDAEMGEKVRRVLGEQPGGLSFDLYILLFTLQLSFPMLFFFRALLIVRTYAKKREGGSAGGVSGLIFYLMYLMRDTGEGPVVRRAKRITFAGILYVIGIIAWWIWWTDKHGI